MECKLYPWMGSWADWRAAAYLPIRIATTGRRGEALRAFISIRAQGRSRHSCRSRTDSCGREITVFWYGYRSECFIRRAKLAFYPAD